MELNYKERRCQVLSKVPLVAFFIENLQEVVVNEVNDEADFAQGLPCFPRKKVIDPTCFKLSLKGTKWLKQSTVNTSISSATSKDDPTDSQAPH